MRWMRSAGPVVGGALTLTALAACSASTGAGTREPATVTVLAAASLTEVFDELAVAFEQEHPRVDVVLSHGGSSSLAQQIVAGAPADVFASADESSMETVTAAGLASDPQVFATNTLRLVVPSGNPGGVTGVADLARPELVVALCDVAVPCGAASARLLAAAGVTADPDTLEQDVKAVLTKVRLGEADAGLVYVTDVAAAGGEVEGIDVPVAPAVVNRYPIAALAGAAEPEAATAFAAFVRSDAGRAVLEEGGFGAP